MFAAKKGENNYFIEGLENRENFNCPDQSPENQVFNFDGRFLFKSLFFHDMSIQLCTITRKETAAGNSARKRFRSGEHVWRRRDRGVEGLIKAEFFEQRRRITTRGTPGASGETAQRKAQCFTVSAGGVSDRWESYMYTSPTRAGMKEITTITAILFPNFSTAI